MKTLKLSLLILFSIPVLIFAQEAAPAAVPAEAANIGFITWIMAHWKDSLAAIAAVIVAARLIVKLTPTPADDSVMERIINLLKHVGLHLPD